MGGTAAAGPRAADAIIGGPADASGRDGAGTHNGGQRRAWTVVADAATVVLLVALAAWLRAPALGPSSLWLDDAWVALVHRTEGWQELRYVGFAAPGFVAVLKGWLAVAGPSELAAQLPAFVAGLLAPPAAFLLARWRRWHRAAALVAGMVLVTSPVAILYATRVKQYTVEALLGVVLLALALWLLDDRTDRRRWMAFVGVGGVATAVSAFLAPTVGAGLLAVLVAELRDGDRAGVGRAVGWGLGYGLAALGWYLAVLAPAVTSSISGFWAEDFLTVDAGFGALVASVRDGMAGVLTGLLPLPVGVGAVLLAAAIVVVVAGRELEVAVLLLTPSVVAVGLAGLQLAPLGGGRTDVHLYPSLALLLAAGVAVGLRAGALRGRWWQGAAAVGALGLSVALVWAAEPVEGYPRQDVRPLVAEVEDRAAADEVILVYPSTVWAYALYSDRPIHLVADPVSSWGFSPRFEDPRIVVLPPGRDDPGAYQPTVASLASSDTEVIWLVATHWREDIDGLRAQLADAGFAGEEVARRAGALLERYERDRPRP